MLGCEFGGKVVKKMKQYFIKNLLVTDMSWQEYQVKKYGTKPTKRNELIKGKGVFTSWDKANRSNCVNSMPHG